MHLQHVAARKMTLLSSKLVTYKAKLIMNNTMKFTNSPKVCLAPSFSKMWHRMSLVSLMEC
jgi:hypothetical protein